MEELGHFQYSATLLSGAWSSRSATTFLGLGFPTLCSGTMTCEVKSQETRSWKVKFIYKFTNNCPETKHLSPRRSRGKRSSMWSYWLLPKSADL